MLPTRTYLKEVEFLKKRLHPAASEVLLPRQLMKRKQRSGEAVGIYVQEGGTTLEISYGKRLGMGHVSKGILKMDQYC